MIVSFEIHCQSIIHLMYKSLQMCHRFVYNSLSHEMNVAFVNAQVNHEQYLDT